MTARIEGLGVEIVQRRGMSLVELYPHIKTAHIGLALTSGALFALRGLAVLTGQRWAVAAPARSASMAIDAALLIAALLVARTHHPLGFLSLLVVARPA